MTTGINDELLQYAESLGYGDVHMKIDAATGLRAIIAIHSTKRGPALGGCRFIEYPTTRDALRDALRLGWGMSYKAAMANLPLGGGKAVLLKTPQITDREAHFGAFGRFVNEMSGRYITAMDSGTEVSDMDVIARYTPYVASTSRNSGDPGPSTALGVLRGIFATVKFKMQRDNLEGLHVAIQGVGHVGYSLAQRLHNLGVRLSICDRNTEAAKICEKEFGAKIVSLDEIFKLDCDIFAPCAYGGIINDETIPTIKAKIIAGSANNQLAELRHGEALRKRDILYAPDYVINAGGLIEAYALYQGLSMAEAELQISHIYDTLLLIFDRAAREGKPTSQVADTIASERL